MRGISRLASPSQQPEPRPEAHRTLLQLPEAHRTLLQLPEAQRTPLQLQNGQRTPLQLLGAQRTLQLQNGSSAQQPWAAVHVRAFVCARDRRSPSYAHVERALQLGGLRSGLVYLVSSVPVAQVP